MQIFLIGFTVPSTLETWTTDTIFVLLSIGDLVKSNFPSLSIGINLNFAPVLLHNCCHGTIFEWCSISVITILSFTPTFRVYERRFSDSVVFLVKIISSFEAFMNLATFSWASSYFSVASSPSLWIALWTFELYFE